MNELRTTRSDHNERVSVYFEDEESVRERHAACYWCKEDCGGTCLELTGSTQMKPTDPAYFLLQDGVRSTPRVYEDSCYICRDPEFAAMGLPLCQECPECLAAGRGTGHIAADDEECDYCGYNARIAWEQEQG